MTKTTKAFTVDVEVYEKAKKLGINLSKLVEEALSEAIGLEFSKELKDIPKTLLKKAIKNINEFPGPKAVDFWTEWLNKRCNTDIKPGELAKYAQYH